MSALVPFLLQRPEAFTLLHPADLGRTLEDLFVKPDWLLPRPYKIFFADEMRPPILGFPVAESSVLRELEARLERWVGDEIAWNLDRGYQKDKVQTTFQSYTQHAIKIAENAMLSNLLADYHAVFWLAHSLDLSRHFSMIPRKVTALDPQLGRAQGDAIKYRIFARWGAEMREQMAALAQRTRPILDGEEERGVQFFRLLQDNLLILTEEFISPDLREIRSFVAGYLHRDFQAFRESVDRLFTLSSEIAKRDTTFRNALTLFGSDPAERIPLGLILDKRFQAFLFEHPGFAPAFNRDEREQLQSLARRICEFAVLHQLRRSISWMKTGPDGAVEPADRKGLSYSRSTRPLDFGRSGVVDPMVHRFGMIYDITSFSEILGSLARAGRAQELSSYRQMLLFQRKLEAMMDRHRMQFEKFLGDGALYTTRRATHLVRAAVEVQRFYAEMRRKGFSFDRGIRIAINYGYYRLLPMKPRLDSNERIMEFYGPGVVELSRLTTGKATKEIGEIQAFLVSHGYDAAQVQQFFAPLAHGVDVVNRAQHERDYFAYINENGHLVNEGIVASLSLVQELSAELSAEATPLVRIPTGWGTCIGFPAGIEGLGYIGLRLLGTVKLKGLADIEVAEIVPFADGTADVFPVDANESFVTLLRQEYHENGNGENGIFDGKTREREVQESMIICAVPDESETGIAVMMGMWNPLTDQIRHSVSIPAPYLQSLGLTLPLRGDAVRDNEDALREFYRRMTEHVDALEVDGRRLDRSDRSSAWLLHPTVERLA